MSNNSNITQNKRNLEKILNFPFGPSQPVPAAVKTTSIMQGSMKKKQLPELQQLERLLGSLLTYESKIMS